MAASSGPLDAGAGASITGPGPTWSSPGNIATGGSASVVLTTSGSNDTSEALHGTNYGFSIPANATIDGITVSINRMSSSNSSNDSVEDSSVRLIKGGTVVCRR
jgi:hypothetical protein